MFKNNRVCKAVFFAMQLITVTFRLHDAVVVHALCERSEIAGLASNLTSTDPDVPIRRFA